MSPFKKITHGSLKGKYRSESGKLYSFQQIKAYYATKGWKRPVKKISRR